MWGTRVSFGVFFEPILDEFGWSRAITSGGSSIATPIAALISLGVGRLNDKFGPRLIIMTAGVLVCLGCVLMSTLHSVPQLYLYNLIMNLGISATLIPVLSTIARWFVKRRALMSGIVLSSTGIGMMIVPPIISQLTSHYGWRTAYVIFGIANLIVVLASAQFMQRDPGKRGLIPYGSTPVTTGGTDIQTEGLSFREGLRTIQLWLLCGIYFCTYFLFSIFIVHIVIHATGQGFPPSQAIGIIVFMGGAGSVGRVLLGVVADRAGNKSTLIISSILMIISLFCLLEAKDLWVLYLFGVIFGLGHGGMATVQSPITAEIFGMCSHGTLLGFIFFCDTIGSGIGPIIAGHIFDITGSYTQAFILCTIVGAINLILVMLLKPIRQPATG